MVALNWKDIYTNLRHRVPNNCYFSGVKINGVKQIGEKVIVTSAANEAQCDFFIAADGVNSSIRAQLFPESAAHYAGYVAWRGTISVSATSIPEKLKENFHYFVLPNGQKGHLLIYSIPALNYQQTKQVLINWMLYETWAPNDLISLMVDKAGMQQKTSLPRGSLSQTHITHLYDLANQAFPPEIAEIITKTQQPFLQVIFDSIISQFTNQSICFLGDAAITLRPHSGSGAAHAIILAITLAKTFSSSDLKNQLQIWNRERMADAKHQSILSQRIGNGLINTTNWAQIASISNGMDQWWAKILNGQAIYWDTNSTKEKKPNSLLFTTPTSSEKTTAQNNGKKINSKL